MAFTKLINLDTLKTAVDRLKTLIAGKVSKSGDTMTGKLAVPYVETGTANDSYFQSKHFRGEGTAGTYYHAIDFGYANHNMVDFHEYGGVWNFYKNTGGTSTSGTLVASIQPDGVHAPLRGNADTATKATQDASGNVITSTYSRKASIVSATLSASSWSDSQYSFESTYPKASYDIEVGIDGDNATDAQYKAWAALKPMDSQSNILKVKGKTPSIDIPILLKITEK